MNILDLRFRFYIQFPLVLECISYGPQELCTVYLEITAPHIEARGMSFAGVLGGVCMGAKLFVSRSISLIIQTRTHIHDTNKIRTYCKNSTIRLMEKVCL